MTVYELRLASRFTLLPGSGPPTLTAAMIKQLVPEALVRSITPAVQGYEVAVQLERGNHAQAMEDLEAALGQLGFTIAQAGITEFATSWLEGAVIGGTGGAALGMATESAEWFILLFLGGLVAGALAGEMKHAAKTRLIAHRTYAQGWQITRLDEPPALGLSPQPA